MTCPSHDLNVHDLLWLQQDVFIILFSELPFAFQVGWLTNCDFLSNSGCSLFLSIFCLVFIAFSILTFCFLFRKVLYVLSSQNTTVSIACYSSVLMYKNKKHTVNMYMYQLSAVMLLALFGQVQPSSYPKSGQYPLTPVILTVCQSNTICMLTNVRVIQFALVTHRSSF